MKHLSVLTKFACQIIRVRTDGSRERIQHACLPRTIRAAIRNTKNALTAHVNDEIVRRLAEVEHLDPANDHHAPTAASSPSGDA